LAIAEFPEIVAAVPLTSIPMVKFDGSFSLMPFPEEAIVPRLEIVGTLEPTVTPGDPVTFTFELMVRLVLLLVGIGMFVLVVTVCAFATSGRPTTMPQAIRDTPHSNAAFAAAAEGFSRAASHLKYVNISFPPLSHIVVLSGF
jgi:hypothetical protein